MYGIGSTLRYSWEFINAGVGATGLTVHVHVYNSVWTQIVTAATATERSKGLYTYDLDPSLVVSYGPYHAVAYTSGVADTQEIWCVKDTAQWVDLVADTLAVSETSTIIEIDESLAGLLNLLRNRLNDLGITNYTTNELKRCILLAKRETLINTKCKKETVEITTTTGRAGKITLAPPAGGTDYAVGNVLTLVQASASGCTVEVVSVADAGVVTGVRLVTQGSGYTTGTKTTTGGSGSSCTVSIAALAPVLTASTHTYDFSPLFEAFEVSLGSDILRRVDVEQQGTSLETWNSTAAGTPTDWMPIQGSKIRIYPTPSAGAVTAATLRVHGYSKGYDLLSMADVADDIPSGMAVPAILDRATAEACTMRSYTAMNSEREKKFMDRWGGWCEKIRAAVKGNG